MPSLEDIVLRTRGIKMAALRKYLESTRAPGGPPSSDIRSSRCTRRFYEVLKSSLLKSLESGSLSDFVLLMEALRRFTSPTVSNFKKFITFGLWKMMSVCLDQLLLLSDKVLGIDWNKAMECFVSVTEDISSYSESAFTSICLLIPSLIHSLVVINYKLNHRYISTVVEISRLLNHLLCNCSLAKRSLVLKSEDVYKNVISIGERLSLVGDFEYQQNLLELFLRLTDKDRRNDVSLKLFGSCNLSKDFMNIRQPEFETDSRVFLNKLNTASGPLQSVYSLSCNKVTSNLNEDLELGSNWIDFNIVSGCISFFIQTQDSFSYSHTSSQELVWDNVYIRSNNISKWTTKMLAGSIVLHIDINKRLSSLPNVKTLELTLDNGGVSQDNIKEIMELVFSNDTGVMVKATGGTVGTMATGGTVGSMVTGGTMNGSSGSVGPGRMVKATGGTMNDTGCTVGSVATGRTVGFVATGRTVGSVVTGKVKVSSACSPVRIRLDDISKSDSDANGTNDDEVSPIIATPTPAERFICSQDTPTEQPIVTLTPYTSTPKPLPPLTQSSTVINSASNSRQSATLADTLHVHVTPTNQIAAKTSEPAPKSNEGLTNQVTAKVTNDAVKPPGSGCPVTQSSTVVTKPVSVVPATSKPSSLSTKPATSKRLANNVTVSRTPNKMLRTELQFHGTPPPLPPSVLPSSAHKDSKPNTPSKKRGPSASKRETSSKKGRLSLARSCKSRALLSINLSQCMDTFDYAEESATTASNNNNNNNNNSVTINSATNNSVTINSATDNSVTINSSRRGSNGRRASKTHPIESASVRKVSEESLMSDTNDHDISVYDFPSSPVRRKCESKSTKKQVHVSSTSSTSTSLQKSSPVHTNTTSTNRTSITNKTSNTINNTAINKSAVTKATPVSKNTAVTSSAMNRSAVTTVSKNTAVTNSAMSRSAVTTVSKNTAVPNSTMNRSAVIADSTVPTPTATKRSYTRKVSGIRRYSTGHKVLDKSLDTRGRGRSVSFVSSSSSANNSRDVMKSISMIEETQLDTEKEIVHVGGNGAGRNEEGKRVQDNNGGTNEKRGEIKAKKVEAKSTRRKDTGRKDSVASQGKKDGGKERNIAAKNKGAVSLVAADTQVEGTEGEFMITRIDGRSRTRGKESLNDSFDDVVKRRSTTHHSPIADRVPSPDIDYDDSDFSIEDMSITYSFNSNGNSNNGDKRKKYDSTSPNKDKDNSTGTNEGRKSGLGTRDNGLAGTKDEEEKHIDHNGTGGDNVEMRNGGGKRLTLSLKNGERIEEEVVTVDDCRYEKKTSRKVSQVNVEKTAMERGRAILLSRSSERSGVMVGQSDKRKGEGSAHDDSIEESMNEDSTGVEYSISSDDDTWSPPTKMKPSSTNNKSAKAVHFAPATTADTNPDFDGVPSVSSSQMDLDSSVMSAFRKECTVLFTDVSTHKSMATPTDSKPANSAKNERKRRNDCKSGGPILKKVKSTEPSVHSSTINNDDESSLSDSVMTPCGDASNSMEVVLKDIRKETQYMEQLYQKARLDHSEFTETQKRRFEEEKAKLNEPLTKLSKEMNKIKMKLLKEQHERSMKSVKKSLLTMVNKLVNES